MALPTWMQRLADQCTDEELARLERTLATPSAASSRTFGGSKCDEAPAPIPQ